MCDEAVIAGTLDMDIRYLQARDLEHPDWWDVDETGTSIHYRNFT